MNANNNRAAEIEALQNKIAAIQDEIDAIDDRLDQGPPPAEEAELEARRNDLVGEQALLESQLNDLLGGGGAITPP